MMSQTMRKYPAKPSLAISFSSCSTCFFARSIKLRSFLGPYLRSHAFGYPLLKKAVHRLAVRHRVARKLIAQIVQFKTEPRGEIDCVLDGSRNIAEERGHLPRCAEVTKVVDCEQAARLIEFDMMADRREQILYFAVVLGRVANAVGCDQRKVQGTRDADGSLIPPFLFALAMALQFDVDVLTAEDARQLFNGFACRRFTAAC
jgi:hypothetical protein